MMIIIRITGGFANQLEYLNIGQVLANKLRTEICLDLGDYFCGYFRPFVLHEFMFPNYKIVNGISSFSNITCITNGESLIEAFESVQNRDYYIRGELSCFSSFFNKYPEHRLTEKSELYEGLILKWDSENVKNFSQGLRDDSIGLHIRLGDFQTLGIDESVQFYKAAIGRLLKQTPEAEIYVFSDDIDEAERVLGCLSQLRFVRLDRGYWGDIEEFFCFSMCKRKVITARSTYSRYATQYGFHTYGCKIAITSEILPGMEKVACTLSAEDFQEGLEHFKSLSLKNSNQNIGVNEYSGIEDKSVDYELMATQPNRFDFDDTQKFWIKYYGIDFSNSRWLIRLLGHFENTFRDEKVMMADLLSRLGAKVVIVNSLCNVNSKSGMEEGIIQRGFNEIAPECWSLYSTGIVSKCRATRIARSLLNLKNSDNITVYGDILKDILTRLFESGFSDNIKDYPRELVKMESGMSIQKMIDSRIIDKMSKLVDY